MWFPFIVMLVRMALIFGALKLFIFVLHLPGIMFDPRLFIYLIIVAAAATTGALIKNFKIEPQGWFNGISLSMIALIGAAMFVLSWIMFSQTAAYNMAIKWSGLTIAFAAVATMIETADFKYESLFLVCGILFLVCVLTHYTGIFPVTTWLWPFFAQLCPTAAGGVAP